MNWAEGYCAGSDSSAAFSFFDSVQDSYLAQHVTSSTRHRQSQQPSLLDLIFTLDPDEVVHLSPLSSSDHDCLLWKFKCCSELPPPVLLCTITGKVIMRL